MPKITRRNFLKVSAAGTATAILAGCDSDERWVELEPYVHAPDEQIAGVATWYASTCRLCPAGCGIVARVINGRAVKLEGNPEHPVNRGRLCARGQSGLQLLYNPDRVTGAVRQPERGTRRFEPLPWNEAINTLYERLSEAGGAVGIWTGSTTPTHLYDLFRRFAEAIGAPAPIRWDLFSSANGYYALEQSSQALFGRATVPTYDMGNADVVFSFGAELFGSWVSLTGYGVEFDKFRSQALGKRGYLVQFEPRMSNTAAAADRWVPIRPGAYALVAQAIMRVIADEGLGSEERVSRAAALAGEANVEEAAAACEMTPEDFVRLVRLFASAERPLAIPGAPLAAGNDGGLAAVSAVHALNVVLGNVGQPGGVRFAPDLPVADLAAPPTSSPEEVQNFIATMKSDGFRVLLVHGANPAYELPPALEFTSALERVETVVSFAPIIDDTAAWADFVLPDRVYLEGWGYQVVSPSFNGVPVISSQQPVVPPFRDTRATGDVLLTVAKGLAADALPWTDEVAFIQERIAELPAGAAGGEDEAVRWARFLQHGGWWPAQAPEPPEVEVTVSEPLEVPAVAFPDEAEYPYFLHLHLHPLLGDGSGASIPWLQGAPDPMTTVSWQTWIEISKVTAEELGVRNGDVLRVISPYGEIEAQVYIFPAIRPDTVAIAFGQGHEAYGRYAMNRGSNPVKLVGAPGGDAGSGFGWSSLRVKLERKDENRPLAIFESTIEPGEDWHAPFSIEVHRESPEEPNP